MRFTIRHLLWFTLLAAVGCWWWMPSANDATLPNFAGYSTTGIGGLLRIKSEGRLQADTGIVLTDTREGEFATRDFIVVSHPADSLFFQMQPRVVSRGRGLFVAIDPWPHFFPAVISISKSA